MLSKSSKYGTALSIGPRLKKFIETGYGHELLWGENYPDQEKETPDGRGEFQMIREWIEVASLEDVFDLWRRGYNLAGFSCVLLRAAAEFRRIVGHEKIEREKERR